MLDVLQKLELAIRPLCKYGSAERFHNLLYGDGRVRELVLCRASVNPENPMSKLGPKIHTRRKRTRPDRRRLVGTEGIDISTGMGLV